jgi:O-antigen/teichoic acid export membrane protein
MTRIRANVLAMGGTFLVQAFFVVVHVKLLTRWLTATEFGLYSSIFALGAVLGSLAELGFSVVLPRYGATFEAAGRPAAFRRLVWTAVRLWAASGLLLCALVGMLALLAVSSAGTGHISPGLLVLGLAAALTFSLRSFASAAFQGLRRMGPAFTLEFLYMAGLTLWFIVFRESLDPVRVFTGFLVLGLLTGIAGLVAFFRVAPHGSPDEPREHDRDVLRAIAPYWLGAFFTTIVAISVENADRLVLATLVPLSAVGAWHVAGRISLFLRKILFIFQQVAGPEFAWKWERGARQQLVGDLVLFMKVDWLIGVLLAMGVAILARFGVLLASNERYLDAVPALIAMAGSMTVLCLAAPMTTFLRAGGRIDITVTAEVIWLAGSLAVGSLLLKPFGLFGFGLGGLVAALGALLYTLAALHRRTLPRPPVRLVATLLPAGLALWAGAAWLGAQPFLASWPVAWAAALGLTGGLGFTLLRGPFFSREERERLSGLMGSGPAAGVGRWLLGAPPSIPA